MSVEVVLPQSCTPVVDLKNEEYTHFSFVSLCKYSLTVRLCEQNIKVIPQELNLLMIF